MNGPPNPPSLRVVEDDRHRTEEALAVAPALGRVLASIEHDRRPELPADPTLQSVTRALGHVLVVLDREHRIVFGSVPPGWTRASGHADVRPGAKLIEAFGPRAAAAIEQAAEQALSQPEPSTIDWATVRDGHRRVASASVTRRLDERGQTVGTTAVIRDETARYEAEQHTADLEQRLAQTQRLDTLGTLVSGIAHDFNNILMPILLAGGDLEEQVAGRPEFAEVAEILEAAERGRDIVRRLLTFAREPTGHEATTVELADVIRDALRLARASIPVTTRITDDVPTTVGSIEGEAIQVHQVVMNLVLNAHQARSSDQAHVRVSVAAVELAPVDLARHPRLSEGRHIRLTVTDDGTGITPDVLPKIFDPFYSTKHTSEGTGLGLAVVLGIVKAQGGSIRVDSEPGMGTTFEVLWPLAQQQQTEPKCEPVVVVEGTGETILCVDDEGAVLRAIGRALRRLGYTVLTADNATDALQACADARSPIDLVITDLTMPGITGLALASELKTRHPDVSIILSSGVTVPPGQTDIDALLPKPYTIGELSEVVARVLGRPAPRDRLRIATPSG